MLNFKFIKRAPVFLILFIAVLWSTGVAFAGFVSTSVQDDEKNFNAAAAAVEALPPKTNGEIVNCFDYYRFPSVQTSFETLKEFYEPGQKVYFKGELINENSYPIVDGYLFVRIGRHNKNYTREWHDIVDEFFVNSGPQGREKFYLDGKEKKGAVFSWNAPENLAEGVYTASFSFIAGKKMNLAGLSFTNEVIAGSTRFEIGKSATGAQRVFLEKSSFAVNGKKYDHIGLSPVFDKGAKVEAAGKIRNNTAQKANLKLVYDLYYWDGLDDKNKISSQSEDITVAPNSSHSFKYVIPKMDETVYFLRITTVAGDGQKSIVNLRFLSEQEKPRINFFSPMKFPVLEGETMTNFACFHNTANKSARGKVIMNVFDESGDKIQTLGYEGEITGRIMAVKKDAVAAKNYDYLRMAASVVGADGRETDSYEMIYDCKNMNPENKECAKIQEEKAMVGAPAKPSDKKGIAFGITALAAIMALAALLRKLFINKARSPLISLFFAFAVGSAVFLASGMGDYASAKDVTVIKNYNFPPNIDCNKNVQGKGIYVGPIWEGDPLWICASGSIQIMHEVINSKGFGFIEKNNVLDVNDEMTFSYRQYDPFYYVTTGANDSPFGEWCDDLSDKSCLVYEQVGYVGANDQATIKDNIDMTWLAVKPDVYMTSDNNSVIACDGMACTAKEQGNATLTANIGKVTARPWIKVHAGKGWEGWNLDYKGDEKMYDIDFNSATLTWDIVVDPPPPTCTASFTPAKIIAGEATTFKWDSLNDEDTIVPITCTTPKYGYDKVSSSGYYSISPETTQTCTVTVENDKGVNTCSATVIIGEIKNPSPTVDLKIREKETNDDYVDGPITIDSGKNIELSWTSENAVSCVLTDFNDVDIVGSVSTSVGLTAAKTYTIACYNSDKLEYAFDLAKVEISPASGGYSLTVNITGTGSGYVSNVSNGVADSTYGPKTWSGYASGASVSLTATADTDSYFVGGWNNTKDMGNCTNSDGTSGAVSGNTCTIILTGNKTTGVTFNKTSSLSSSSKSADPGTANLTLKKNGSGKVQLYGWRDDSWNDYGDTVDSDFQNNETQGLKKDWWFKISAVPGSGYSFSGWSGCTSTSEGKSWTDADGVVHYSTPSSGENACYMTMTGGKTVTVTFTGSSGPGGGGGGGSSVKAYISAQNTVVTDGNNTVVTWTSDNATSCEQVDDSGLGSGSYKDTGWISASDTASGNYTTASFTTSGGPRTYKVTCKDGSQSADAEVTVNVGDYAGSPSVSMWADPQSVGYKKTSMIQWLSSNVFPNSCLLFSAADTMNGYLAYFNFLKNQYFGPGYYNAGISYNNSTGTGQKTGKLSGNTVYKIQCRGLDFTNIQSQTTVTVAKPVSNFTLTNPTGGSLVATIVEGLSANSSSISLTLSGEAVGNVNLSASIPAISGAKAQFSSDDGAIWSDTLSVDISAISQVKIKVIKIPGATPIGTYNTAITATDTGTGGKTKKLNVNLRVNKVSSEWKEF